MLLTSYSVKEIIQENYHQQILSVLIPTLEDQEPRYAADGFTAPVATLINTFSSVHAHAAAAPINFYEEVARDTLLPYLDPIVKRLLKLLNPAANPMTVRRYVQEQAITTLAMVADASEATFSKVTFPFRGGVLTD